MEMDFRELYEVSSKDAIRYFHSKLKEIPTILVITPEERLYVASILANFAQTSVKDTDSSSLFSNLSEVFNRFVLNDEEWRNPLRLENAGAQSLIFNGFFRDQMRYRHNVKWHDELGQAFYKRVSLYSKDRKRRDFFDRFSNNFPPWTRTCCLLHRFIREEKLLIPPPQADTRPQS
jgi:hypothetical protein